MIKMYFKNGVDADKWQVQNLKTLLEPLRIVAQKASDGGDIIHHSIFAFKEGITKNMKAAAFRNPYVTIIEYDIIADDPDWYNVTYYSFMKTWTLKRSKDSPIVKAMLEISEELEGEYVST